MGCKHFPRTYFLRRPSVSVTQFQNWRFEAHSGLRLLTQSKIDLDTPDLKALQAVLAPKKLNTFQDKEKDPSFWEASGTGF